MFWMFAPMALVGIAAVIASSVSDGERKARRRWESGFSEAGRRVEEHRRSIERRIDEVQEVYDFRVLVDVHYSSHRVAASAYRLLEDARVSISSMSDILDQISGKKGEVKNLINGSSPESRRALLAEIRSMNEFKMRVVEDLRVVKKQRDSLYSEVVRLNAKTAGLKAAIRDRCGERGRDWFVRLEQRTRSRQKNEGKQRA